MPHKTPEQTYKGVRVLVTGAGGFIGSRLAVRLAEEGAIVSVVVHRRDHAALLQPSGEHIPFYEADLRIPLEAHRVIEESRPEIVFNVASLTDTRRTFDILDAVLEGTYGVAKAVVGACVQHDVRKLVHFGTIEEYGTNDAPFFEHMREAPISPYSLGKVMATYAVLLAGKLTALKVCVLRPAATYGGGKSFTMLIPNIIRSALEGKDFEMNDGEQLRDFVYVDDVVEGALKAGRATEADGEIINLGSGKGMKVREIAEMVNKTMGNPIRINFGVEEYRPLDGDVFYMNSEKAYKLLQWKASADMIHAIDETVRWYREHYKDLIDRV